MGSTSEVPLECTAVLSGESFGYTEVESGEPFEDTEVESGEPFEDTEVKSDEPFEDTEVESDLVDARDGSSLDSDRDNS